MINNPTAVALDFTANVATGGAESEESPGPRKVLIFDFGGSTLDISILEIKGRTSKILANTFDIHIGGSDIDNTLVKYTIQKIKEKNPEFEVS